MGVPERERAVAAPCADVLVLGAGLAGTATAAALAEWSCRVIVVDTPAHPPASAVPLALMAPYPTRARDPLTRLRGRGLATTRAWLARLGRAGFDSGHRLDGVLLIPARPRDRQRRDRFAETDTVRRVTPPQALARAGVLPPESAVLHACGACVDPQTFGRALLHAGGAWIQRRAAHVMALERHGGQWHALDAAGCRIASAAQVVIAAGYGSARFTAAAADYLTPLRGQATAIAATAETRALRCAVSYGGYVLPPIEDRLWVGATATRDDVDCQPRDTDDRENLQRLAQLWPELESPPVLDRFVAIRATTGTRLPLIGAGGDGMWLNTGHGAHGLLTAPLAGRMVAHAIVQGDAGRARLNPAPSKAGKSKKKTPRSSDSESADSSTRTAG